MSSDGLGDDRSQHEVDPPPGDPTPEQIGEMIRQNPGMIASAFRATMYQGQFPHPEIIEGWERHCPGSADRILRMAERQQDH